MQLIMKASKFVLFSTLCWGIFLVWYIRDNMTSHVAPIEFAQPQLQLEEQKLIFPFPEQNKSITPSATKPIVAPVPKTDDSVWKDLSHQLKLDHQANHAQVQNEVRKLLKEQDKFYQILKAAGPYIYFILEQTKAKGLPAEIALIPVIESEFNPHDYSTKGATGLWQFMRGTAKELGIVITSGYDGRKNVTASTKAALAYLNDLGNNFKGNWYLAFAAYNVGEGRVRSAIRRAGTHTFWNLASLPKETRYYIPKLLAVAAIVKNPEKYGVTLPPIQNKPYFAEFKIKNSVELEKIAKISGATLESLKVLNPDYKNGNVQPKNGAYTLLVPLAYAASTKAYLADKIISQQ
jgi:membrane-bound lytic murein transglycosylase D